MNTNITVNDTIDNDDDIIDQVVQDLADDNDNIDDSAVDGDINTANPQSIQVTSDQDTTQKEIQITSELLETAGNIVNQVKKFRNALKSVDPFSLLKIYEPLDVKYFNAGPHGHPLFSYPNMGLINDASYCEFVDLYNLYHPENILNSMNFFSDYHPDGKSYNIIIFSYLIGLVRKMVMDVLGVDTMPYVHKHMNRGEFYAVNFSPLKNKNKFVENVPSESYNYTLFYKESYLSLFS